MSGDGMRPRDGPARRPARLSFDDGDDDYYEGFAYSRPSRRRARHGRPRLFTATVALAQSDHVVLVFHASIARSPSEVRLRLRGRLGEVGAALARIREGYHESDFIARTIVAPALKMLLRDVEAAPECGTATGFDVQHVQVVGVEA